MSEPTAPRRARHHLHQVTAGPLSGAASPDKARGDKARGDNAPATGMPRGDVLARKTSSTDAPIGILAGGGALPRIIAEAIIQSGRRVHIVGLKGEADASIEDYAHSWCNWGAIGGMLRAFRQAGCRELIIIGAVRRPDLARIRPDLGFFRSLPTVLALMRGGDDSVLSKVVRFFEAQGFIVRGGHEVAPQLLAGTGPMGTHAATPSQACAIARGAALLRALAPFDVGQAVLASPEKIIAVEGTSGTDAMVRGVTLGRATTEAGAGVTTGAKSDVDTLKKPSQLADMVLVKLPKPGQEMRVDMPTIGPQTIELMHAARVTGVAVAGNATLMLERDSLIALADDAGLFVTGFKDGVDTGIGRPPLSQLAPIEACASLQAFGRAKPRSRDWQDIDMGARLLGVLKAQNAGHAAIVSRNYVLAVQSVEPLARLLQSLERGQPWGSLLAKRRGVLVLRARLDRAAGQRRLGYPLVDAEVVQGAQRAGLAGIVFCDAAVALAAPGVPTAALDSGENEADESGSPLSEDVLGAADAAGLFVVGPGHLGRRQVK